MNKKSKEISEEDKVTQASENVVEGIELTANEIETLKEEEVVNLKQVENQEIQVTDEIAEKPIELEVNIPSESIVDEEVTDSEESAVEEEPVPLDLSGQSKAQLLDLIKERINSPNALKSDKTIQEIKNAFDVLSNKEREDAMQQFLGEGGIADDFEYKVHLSIKNST